jgi:hypothetical protein
LLLKTKRLAYAPLYPIALDGARGVLARHQNAESRPARAAPLEIEGIAVQAAPRAVAQQALEFGFSP